MSYPQLRHFKTLTDLFSENILRIDNNMETHLTRKRNKIIYETWEKEKNNLSMKNLRDIFRVPLKTIYRIIRHEKIKVDKNNKIKIC